MSPRFVSEFHNKQAKREREREREREERERERERGTGVERTSFPRKKPVVFQVHLLLLENVSKR